MALPLTLPEERDDYPLMDFVPPVFCPTCCSTVDIAEERYGNQRLDCLSCGTVFVVQLDPDIIARHGI